MPTPTQRIKHLEREWGYRVAWREVRFKDGTKDFSIDIFQSNRWSANLLRTTVGFGPTFEAAVEMAEKHMKEELARLKAEAK